MESLDASAATPNWFDRHAPASVIIFRARRVGDMLCAVPALRALRWRLPDAHIALVGLPCAEQFVHRFAMLVDEFIPFPGHSEMPERPPAADAYLPFLESVRARHFDLALQLHGHGRIVNALVAQFGTVWQAGFDDDASARGASFLRYPAHGHEIHRLLALTTHLGATPRGDHLRFPLLDADARELARANLTLPPPGAPYVCLHPGARDAARCWPAERFAALGDALAAQGLQIVLIGSEAERPLTAAVAAAMCAPAFDAAAAISLGAMAQLMAGAALIVCNDIGTSHIACGLGLPSVVIFRASEMSRWAPLDPSRHRAVWDPLGVRAQAVLDEALDLLVSTSASSASA